VYTLSNKECDIKTLNFINSPKTLTAIYTCGEDANEYSMGYAELKALIPAENKTEPVNNNTDPNPQPDP